MLISREVGYQVVGSERTILEGAAARAFKHVSGSTLDLVMEDSQIQGRSKMTKGHKVMSIVEAYRHEWGWSDADVARIMLEALPEYATKQRETKPQVDAEDWGDLAAMAEAMSVVSTGQEMEGEAEAAPCDGEVLLQPLARVMDGDCGQRGRILYKLCVCGSVVAVAAASAVVAATGAVAAVSALAAIVVAAVGMQG